MILRDLDLESLALLLSLRDFTLYSLWTSHSPILQVVPLILPESTPLLEMVSLLTASLVPPGTRRTRGTAWVLGVSRSNTVWTCASRPGYHMTLGSTTTKPANVIARGTSSGEKSRQNRGLPRCLYEDELRVPRARALGPRPPETQAQTSRRSTPHPAASRVVGPRSSERSAFPRFSSSALAQSSNGRGSCLPVRPSHSRPARFGPAHNGERPSRRGVRESHCCATLADCASRESKTSAFECWTCEDGLIRAW